MVTLSCSNSTPELVSLPVKTRRSNNKKGNKTNVCAKRQKKITKKQLSALFFTMMFYIVWTDNEGEELN